MTPEDKTTVQTAANEVADDVALVMKVMAAVKSKDKAAMLALLPQVAAEVKEDAAALRAVAPLVKAGHKSTEFWMVAGVILLVAVFPAVTGKALALDQEAIMATVAGVYTLARTFAKKQ